MLKPLIVSALLAVSFAATSVPVSAESALEQYKRSCANVLNFLPRVVRKSTVAAISVQSISSQP